MEILYCAARGRGWAPVDELVTLAARLLGATVTTVRDRGEASAFQKALSLLPSRRGRERTLLVIAANPALLSAVARPRQWFPGYARSAAWVIDAFWTDRVARFATRGRFDHVFVTTPDLVDEWRRISGSAVHVAAWGADTLAHTAIAGERTVDLLRLGRQPQAWDDDDRVRVLAAEMGIRTAGRPPFAEDPAANQRAVREALSGTRFVLAFHNLVSPAPYTHPTRDYLTGRWTDALAAGATVLGAAPRSAAGLLWPGATVEIDPHDLRAGLAQARVALDAWTPERAAAQATTARRELDWRHRLVAISATLDLPIGSALRHELEMLRR